MVKLPEYHVLNFLHDKDFGCALTVLVHGAWYHVIADPKRFNDRSRKGKIISREYRRLLSGVKASEGAEDGGGTAPLFVQESEGESCDEGERDSAVDVSTPAEEEDKDNETEAEFTITLERWMLNPLNEAFSQNSEQKTTKRSVQDWYHCRKHFFDLLAKDGKLQAEEDENPSERLRKRLDFLVPSMHLPKYIRNLEIPTVSAADLTVLSESSDPAPVHPTRVKHIDGNEYFLKTVDPNQHQPTKREIQVMRKIESEGLQHELRVPLLRGLVNFTNGPKSHMMGFIMDAIDDPTPLTCLIDSEVDEGKRLAWAAESARMVDVLHQHGIIWGDAKGDNFMVDKNDKLWIIDFGGSYTEGWVDPELKETEDGDDMGVRKICNGLEDPENNTIKEGEEEEELSSEEEEDKSTDEGEEQVDAEVDHEEELQEKDLGEFNPSKSNESNQQDAENDDRSPKSRRGNKRKANDYADDDEPQEADSRKQRRTESNDDDRGTESLYCFCQKPSSGQMIGCDGENCKVEWFHFDCVGLTEEPEDKKWFCDNCKEA